MTIVVEPLKRKKRMVTSYNPITLNGLEAMFLCATKALIDDSNYYSDDGNLSNESSKATAVIKVTHVALPTNEGKGQLFGA